MELKATLLGKHLAQHPYNRIKLLHAGVEVAGDKHEYLIPFNKLIAVHCKRGIFWGELEFELLGKKVVRLHGTEWQETQRFYTDLQQSWGQWSRQMSQVCADALQQQVKELQLLETQDKWMKQAYLEHAQQQIQQMLHILPMPAARLSEFESCKEHYHYCLNWLEHGSLYREQHNDNWLKQLLIKYAIFFANPEWEKFSFIQSKAIVSEEAHIFVSAGAGSGKSALLLARAQWLLQRNEATPEQILLLVDGQQSIENINKLLKKRLGENAIQVKDFHMMLLEIVQQTQRKNVCISQLETDKEARRALLLHCWQSQCAEKKAYANGWKQWLCDDFGWDLPDGAFWQDEKIINCIIEHLDKWLSLLRIHGGSQGEIIAQAASEERSLLTKRIRLITPLLKAWKSALKEQGATDLLGLIHQAINVLNKGRFISPWKHILVDDYQNILPQQAQVLALVCKQNKQTNICAVGDDWQTICHFNDYSPKLPEAFFNYFGKGECYKLEQSYRFDEQINSITHRFTQRNPTQLTKTLYGIKKGSTKSIVILPDNQLAILLDKLSGYAKPEDKILILGRYDYLKPDMLSYAAIRWPMLQIDFLTIDASIGQQAEYVIIIGLQSGLDGFPAITHSSIIERVLLPLQDGFPEAQERRLLYIALTRARQRVWLLKNSERPSIFIDQLKKLGVVEQKRA